MSSIFRKLFTLGRGKANDIGQGIVDANSITILEQEIRDSEAAILETRKALTSAMADLQQNQSKLEDLRASEQEYTGWAREAKAKGDQELALRCAEQVLEVQGQIEQEAALVEEMKGSVDQMTAELRELEASVEKTKRLATNIKATDKLQKAQELTSRHTSGANGKISGAMDTAKRLQESQAHKREQYRAEKELSKTGADRLKDDLASKGIGKTSKSAADLLNGL